MSESPTTSRPRVIVHAIASVDGRLTVAPDVLLLHGDQRWPVAEGESEVGAWLRATYQPEATLEGSGSFVLDDHIPELLPSFSGDPKSLYQDFLPLAIVNRPDHRGWFAVVDGRGRVRWGYKDGTAFGMAGWHLLVLVGRHTPQPYLAYLQREGIPYLVAGEEQIDLRVALEKIRNKLGVLCMLSTAGGRLNGALLRAGLVDEIHIEVFPAIIGGLDTPSLFDAPALEPGEQPTRLELIAMEAQANGRVWLRYRVI